MTKISVIVPVYNVEKYIEECINSLINQTFTNIEIIIINDGSLDSSGIIVNNIEQKDKRIKVIHQKNLGLPGARNTGLSIATGEYIGFVDSDDIVKPEMYEVLFNNITENNSDISVCNFSRFDRKNEIKNTRYNNSTLTFEARNSAKFYSHALDSSCNKLYRTNIIRNNNLHFESKSIVPQEDFYFLVKYLAHSSKISSVSEALYNYRIRKSSITNTKQAEGFIEGCLNFVNLTRKYHDELKIKRDISSFEEYLFINMMQSAIHNSHPSNPDTIEEIILFFSQNKMFNDAVTGYLNNNKEFKNLRDIYNYLIYYLLKNNFIKLPSLLEFIRVKRLQRKTTTSNNYD